VTRLEYVDPFAAVKKTHAPHVASWFNFSSTNTSYISTCTLFL